MSETDSYFGHHSLCTDTVSPPSGPPPSVFLFPHCPSSTHKLSRELVVQSLKNFCRISFAPCTSVISRIDWFQRSQRDGRLATRTLDLQDPFHVPNEWPAVFTCTALASEAPTVNKAPNMANENDHGHMRSTLKGITTHKKKIKYLAQLIFLNNNSKLHQLEQIR